MFFLSRRAALAWLVCILAAILALVCRKNAPAAFFWFFLCAGIALGAPFFILRSGRAHGLAMFIFSIFLALACGELLLKFVFIQDQPQRGAAATVSMPDGPNAWQGEQGARTGESWRRYTENGKEVRWTFQDPVTGYRARPSGRTRATELRNGVTIYDVIYSTNDQGWRMTPQHPEAGKAAVFFGCSYTFGECLNDEEAFVWQLAEKLGKDWQTFNFGFSGFGPHQFLRLLECGALDSITGRYKETWVFYLGLAGHELRSGGYSAWDSTGPWYEEDADGQAVYRGSFADKIGKYRHMLDKFFKKSAVYSLLFKSASVRKADGELQSLQRAIIKTAADKIKVLPGASFTLLLWPGNEKLASELTDISTLELGPAFPGMRENRDKYVIPGDGHPNALAHSLAAEHIFRYMSR